ncbi:hypothetical protein M0638_00020 [Roseomonas sp. NAR14]|uniref:Uncharacterized protein n=1 Tax=Roseomonas acroporae TaxID=2937791 RepID=A0A9X1Y5V2_9PROT|nr:hypothetical protein [Roseomonas acroporae]MCK8782765.1 hypothetical protein [Roseomonas acroporae]
MSVPQLQAVQDAIEAMARTLAMAGGLAQGGRRIDLAGLDAEMASICDAAMRLPKGMAAPLRPSLEHLLLQVEQLGLLLAA